jgi:putative transposase
MVPAPHIHLVLVTNYRRGALIDERLHYPNAIFGTVCSDLSAALAGRNREDDHLHLLARYPTQVSVAALVNSLKGAVAPMLRQRYRIRTHSKHL